LKNLTGLCLQIKIEKNKKNMNKASRAVNAVLALPTTNLLRKYTNGVKTINAIITPEGPPTVIPYARELMSCINNEKTVTMVVIVFDKIT